MGLSDRDEPLGLLEDRFGLGEGRHSGRFFVKCVGDVVDGTEDGEYDVEDDAEGKKLSRLRPSHSVRLSQIKFN